MKNFSKSIAAIGMSLLTVGAMAQVRSNFVPHKVAAKTAGPETRVQSIHKTRSAGVGNMSAQINYLDGDFALLGAALTRWEPALYMNTAYTLADTGTSPLSSGTANTDLAHSCTVTYDTLWDLYSQSFITPYPGSVSIDTIQVDFAYHNTSGGNDTVVFQVYGVTSQGFKNTSNLYGTDTVILNASSFTYNSITSFDSVQTENIVLNNPIAIPISARHGWNFAIQMKVQGSKLDTVGVWYYSQASSCSNFGICPARTFMGVPDVSNESSPCENVNSFVTGNQWFNDARNGGDGTVQTWPSYPGSGTGTTYGECSISTGAYYYGFGVLATCTDTNFYYEQDLGIYPMLSYALTGVNSINASGLSVGQNYPNPFNTESTINYSLTKSSNVTFTVYDVTGRAMMTNNYGNVAPGQYQINLSANAFAPGIYFYTFNVNGSTITKKMVITE